jgi:hypothetical protein
MVLYKVGKRMSAAGLHHHYFFRERGEQFGRKEADHECTEACKSRKTHAIVVFVRLFVVALDVAFVPVFLVFFGGGATCGLVSYIGDCSTARASVRTSIPPAELPFATLAFITIRTEHSGKAGRTRLQHKLHLSWRLYLHLAFQFIGLKSLRLWEPTGPCRTSRRTSCRSPLSVCVRTFSLINGCVKDK